MNTKLELVTAKNNEVEVSQATDVAHTTPVEVFQSRQP